MHIRFSMNYSGLTHSAEQRTDLVKLRRNALYNAKPKLDVILFSAKCGISLCES